MKRVAAGAALLLLATVGCGPETGGDGSADAPLTVYLSVPLSGVRAAEGRRIAADAEAVLASAGGRAGDHSVQLKVLDDTGGGSHWSPVATGANARQATEDADTIAYIGELDPEATATSLPITNLADVPQLTLGAVPRDIDVENLIQRQGSSGTQVMRLLLAALEAAGSEATDRITVRDQLRDAVVEAVG